MLRNLIHKLQDNMVKVTIYKTVKQCCVQLAYLVTEICNKYLQLIKSKVKYLPYKVYNYYVKQDSVKDIYLSHL